MVDDPLPEADAVEGYSHPRMTETLFGHQTTEGSILSGWNAGRLHHAIMLTGPKGIGKASLAWRAARFLLDPPDGSASSLDSDWDSAVGRRVSALSEPRLLLARRGWDEKAKRLRTQITVDDMRDFKGFFTMSATDGGWRVAIIDAADEMNRAAANAVLKILEEPPARTVIFLIAHQPFRLLPTIRSRCMVVPMSPLNSQDMEAALRQQNVQIDVGMEGLSQLAQGSVGQALRLIEADGQCLYSGLLQVFAASKADREVALKLADSCVGAANAPRYDILVELISVFLARLAKQSADPKGAMTELVSGEARVLNRLVSGHHKSRIWADLALTLPAKTQYARAVNLDPSSVILDMLLEVEKAARQ